MIDSNITDKVLTIGPATDMKGGIAQVLQTYFAEVIGDPKFIADTVNSPQPLRVMASVGAVFRLMWRLATDRDIRVVHMHTATKVSFPRSAVFASIARAFGRKTVLHIHGANFDDYYRRHPGRVRRAMERSTRVVALSDSWRDFFEREIGVDNVVVIPNIISDPRPVPVEPDGRVHALFLGLIGERKGVFDLVEVLRDIHPRLRGRFMLHIGGNGDTDRLQREIQRLGIADIVTFHGWVRDTDKRRLLSQSSIYVLPSYGEGLPISILEAMSYGNAVISTAIGGIPEVVGDDNGALIAPGDRKALADALLSMVDDPDAVVAMGRRSVEKSRPYLSTAVERCLGRMYQELVTTK